MIGDQHLLTLDVFRGIPIVFLAVLVLILDDVLETWAADDREPVVCFELYRWLVQWCTATGVCDPDTG